MVLCLSTHNESLLCRLPTIVSLSRITGNTPSLCQLDLLFRHALQLLLFAGTLCFKIGFKIEHNTLARRQLVSMQVLWTVLSLAQMALLLKSSRWLEDRHQRVH